MLVRQKNAYKAECWAAARRQCLPKFPDELPERVEIAARFFLRNRRDEDKLKGSLEWALDALKANQPPQDALRWRQNLSLGKGYFRDDDPTHARITEPEQRIDRKYQRLELTIEEAA